MRFTAHVTQEGIIHTQPKSYKKVAIGLSALLLAAVCIATVAILYSPNSPLVNPQLVSNETSSFPTQNSLYVDHSQTTGIIVDISGNSIPADAYFTVNTTSTGKDVPPDAGAPLGVVQGVTAQAYFDVKVTSNVTITSDVMVKITITNPAVNQESLMYYWNTTQTRWVAVPAQFTAPHTISGALPVSALSGTPIGIGEDNATPTPPPEETPTPTPRERDFPNMFVIDEYALGALVAMIVSFAAFGLFAARKRTSKQQ